MSTVRFTLRQDKKDANGLIPIEMVYQISGKRGYHHFKKKTPEQNWDAENHRVIFYNAKAAKKLFPDVDPDTLLQEAKVNDINYAIDGIKTEIQRIEREFDIQGRVPYGPESEDGYLPKDIIQKLSGRPLPLYKPEGPTSKSITDIIQEYIDKHEKDRAPGSLNIYKNNKRFLLAYQEANGPVTFDQINEEFFNKYKQFLNVDQEIGNVTTFRTLSGLKTLLKYAKKKVSGISDGYKDFKMKRDELEVISLTMDEFKKIHGLDYSDNARLDGVRDCLIFSCTTGLRWSDMDQLNRHHIKDNHIEIAIKKTGDIVPLKIPLNKYSRAILAKYAKNEKPIPIISNVKMNLYLKEIGQDAEMDDTVEIVRKRGNKTIKKPFFRWKRLTCHVGRKTFATLHLELDMPAEVVMEIGGWRDYRSFKRYVNISDQRKESLMTDAWDKLDKPKAKPKNKLKAVK